MRNTKKQRAVMYKELFNSPTGRKVLLDMVQMGGVFSAPNPSASVSEQAFSNGARWIILQILGQLNASDQELVELPAQIRRQGTF